MELTAIAIGGVATLWIVILGVIGYVLYVFITTCNAVKRYMNYKNAEYEKQINDKQRDDMKRELEELKRKE